MIKEQDAAALTLKLDLFAHAPVRKMPCLFYIVSFFFFFFGGGGGGLFVCFHVIIIIRIIMVSCNEPMKIIIVL